MKFKVKLTLIEFVFYFFFRVEKQECFFFENCKNSNISKITEKLFRHFEDWTLQNLLYGFLAI